MVSFSLVIVLSVRLPCTDPGYPYGIFFFGHCDVCPSSMYGSWLPLWYLFPWSLSCLSVFHVRILVTPMVSYSLVIMLSVRLPCTDPGYPYGIFFFGHCVVSPSSMYESWLPLWYLILWSLCCLSVFHVRILVTPMVSFSLVIVLSVRLPCTYPGYPYGILFFGHYVVCPSSMYGSWLPLWYLYLWSLCCLSVFHIRILVTPMVSYSLVIVLSVRLPCTDPGYPYGIIFFGHCVVCPSSMYGSWLPLWYLILWSLCCLSVFHVRILVTPMVSFSLVIVLSVRLPCTDPGYPYGIFFFGHYVVCPSSMYGSWLPLWYLFLWSLCCLSVFHVRILVTPMLSYSLVIVLYVRLPCTDPGYPYGILFFGHCVVCPSSMYGSWLPLWYLQTLLTTVIYKYIANKVVNG